MKIILWLEQINCVLGKTVKWFALCMVLMQFFVVMLRYVFGYSYIFLNESVLYLNSMMFMLSAGYTLLVDGHVRVDIFYAKCSTYQKAIIDVLGNVFFLVPSMLALLYWSWTTVYAALKIKEGAIDVGGIPGIWLLKLLIPAFCITVLIQSSACIIKNALVIINERGTHG